MLLCRLVELELAHAVDQIAGKRIRPSSNSIIHHLEELAFSIDEADNHPRSSVDFRWLFVDLRSHAQTDPGNRGACRFMNTYSLGHEIGRGSSSTVYTCIHEETQKVRAVRILHIRDDFMPLTDLREFMESLKHVNLKVSMLIPSFCGSQLTFSLS